MLTTRLLANGRFTLPKSVRDGKAWKPGTEFTVELTKEGVLLRPVKPFPATQINSTRL